MYAAADAELASVPKLIGCGYFSPGDGHLFAPIPKNLTRYDPYFVLADFRTCVHGARRHVLVRPHDCRILQ